MAYARNIYEEVKKLVSKIRQTILSVSIALIFALFVGYGISTFYGSPKYEMYCKDRFGMGAYETKEACEAEGGRWFEIECPEDIENCKSGYCDPSYTCMQEYDSAREVYDRNVFIITLIIGLVAIITGGIMLSVESVGSGIMGGGVLTVVYGTIRYWGHAPDALRFTILGVALAVLLWLGYTRLNPDAGLKNIKESLSTEKNPEAFHNKKATKKKAIKKKKL